MIILTLILTNSGNYGLPISEYAFGNGGLFIASIVMVIYIFYTHTLGIFIAASDKGNVKTALINMLKVPVFYALLLALILNYFKVSIPVPVFAPIKSVGLAAIPLNLLLVGINLSHIKLGKNTPLVIIISIIKLTVIPAFAFVILKIFGVGGLGFKISLVQIAMPSAVYCSILSSHFDCDSELASQIVLVSLLLSALSLTGIIYFLQMA